MQTGFDQWALVELMGHQRIAGRVTEAEIGGCKFVRVDVPERVDAPALTKYLGPSSIYAITPVDEQTARALAARCAPEPVSVWEARALAAKQKVADSGLSLAAGAADDDDEDGDGPF